MKEFKVGDRVLVVDWDIGEPYWNGPGRIVYIINDNILVVNTDTGKQGGFDAQNVRHYSETRLEKIIYNIEG